LLGQVSAGDREVLEELMPLVYEHLRVMAAQRLAEESPGNTLQPTALVHEAFLRIVAGKDSRWSNRQHFYSAAAIAMRRILVDRARSRKGPRRGGDRLRVSMDEAEKQHCVTIATDDVDWIELDLALEGLQERDPALAHLVHLRYFAGLRIEDVAELLGVSPSSVVRDWQIARAWLLREMRRRGGE
jgi:hypothetical protein